MAAGSDDETDTEKEGRDRESGGRPADEEGRDRESGGRPADEADTSTVGTTTERRSGRTVPDPPGDRQEDSGDGDWQFAVDDFPESVTEPSEDGDSEGNVTGSLIPRSSLEPGDIDPENAFFVALGVVIVVGLIAAVVLGF